MVSRASTAMEIGMEYHKAAKPSVISTIRICSVPYATEDKASEDRMASAFSLLSFSSPSSWDFIGLPIKNRFTRNNIVFSPPVLFNRYR
ncbi:hypothetical protein D3C76_1442680 [compost metagenome]